LLQAATAEPTASTGASRCPRPSERFTRSPLVAVANPELPDEPEDPELPEDPEDPDEPELPEEPEEPELPEEPEDPPAVQNSLTSQKSPASHVALVQHGSPLPPHEATQKPLMSGARSPLQQMPMSSPHVGPRQANCPSLPQWLRPHLNPGPATGEQRRPSSHTRSLQQNSPSPPQEKQRERNAAVLQKSPA
jgi:hypothetical protein